MAYEKTNWVDQNVENPRTYQPQENEDGTTTFFDAFGEVIELGTPVNASNLNKIENELQRLGTVIDEELVDINNYQQISGNKVFTGDLSAKTVASTSNDGYVATTAFVKNVMLTSGAGFATWSKATNGYVKFAGGIIIQWGQIGSASSNLNTITLPTAFASTNYKVCGTPINSNASEIAVAMSPSGKTTSSFQIYTSVNFSGTIWIAIGY